MGTRRFPLVIATLVAAIALSLTGCGGDDAPATTPDAAAPAVSGAPRHIIYLSEFNIHTVLERLLPNGPGPLERVETFRQLPAAQTILPPQNRIARIDGVVIARLPAREIARRLRTAINGSCTAALPCRSHLVAIDDIGVDFAGRGGTRLRSAMRLLDAPSPWGSTYAKRVVMYVAYPMLKAIASPGPPARWADALDAVASGESYWLEMYKSIRPGVIGDVDYDDWVALPAAIMRGIVARGGTIRRGHFMMGPGTGIVAGMPITMCPSRVGCSWVASGATPLNKALAHNGTGIYRFGPRQLGALCFQTIATREPDDNTSHDVIKHLCREWTLTAPVGSTRAQH